MKRLKGDIELDKRGGTKFEINLKYQPSYGEVK